MSAQWKALTTEQRIAQGCSKSLDPRTNKTKQEEEEVPTGTGANHHHHTQANGIEAPSERKDAEPHCVVVENPEKGADGKEQQQLAKAATQGEEAPGDGKAKKTTKTTKKAKTTKAKTARGKK